MPNVFKLYQNCIPVNGASQNVICDLQRSEVIYINDFQYRILKEFKDNTIGEIQEEIGSEEIQKVLDFFDYLINRELGFWCDSPEHFPDIDFSWEAPSFITNCIIDIDDEITYDFKSVVEQLDELGCNALQIRFFGKSNTRDVELMLESTLYSRLTCIELILKYSPDVNEIFLENLCRNNQRIRIIHVHTVPLGTKLKLSEDSKVNLYLHEIQIDGNHHCGVIDKSHFVLNMYNFTEAQKHNTCLNRKIGIDSDGNIKNCPSLNNAYGNVENVKLKDVILNESFTKMWYLNKDQIKICKDCEYRYICSDCRAFIEDSDDIYSKPKKCNYNPYTLTWE